MLCNLPVIYTLRDIFENMKTTQKLRKSIANLETALGTIDTIEKDVKTALKSYYKDKIDGRKEFRLKTVFAMKKLSMKIYFKVDGKAVIKECFVFYSDNIIEEAIEKIDKQLN